MKGLSEMMDRYSDDEEEEEDFEEEYEEEDDNKEPFIIRMTKCYNFLVDAVEYMPPSMSKEFKYKKDQDKARSFYLKLSNIAKDYHKFLTRMKTVT